MGRNSKSNKNKGRKFEDKVQKTLGSGNLWFSKGDLHYENRCVECKFTDKKGFSITLNILEKLWSQALDSNKDPLLVIGIRRNDEEVFIVTADVKLERQQRRK